MGKLVFTQQDYENGLCDENGKEIPKSEVKVEVVETPMGNAIGDADDLTDTIPEAEAVEVTVDPEAERKAKRAKQQAIRRAKQKKAKE